MAKKKSESKLNKIKNTILKLQCGKCGIIKNVCPPDPELGYKGTKCKGCGRFDDFYGEYTKDENTFSLVTVSLTHHEVESNKVDFGVMYMFKCGNSKKVYDFFKERKYTLSEANNIIYYSGLNNDKLMPYYSVANSDEENEKQKKTEEKLAKQLKKIVS